MQTDAAPSNVSARGTARNAKVGALLRPDRRQHRLDAKASTSNAISVATLGSVFIKKCVAIRITPAIHAIDEAASSAAAARRRKRPTLHHPRELVAI
jgi:hypothetical protein